jgi:hypothetical protein
VPNGLSRGCRVFCRNREAWVGDGQRVAVVAVTELELALEIGAPQVVRRDAGGQRRAGGPGAGAAEAFDQAVPVQDGVDGALSRDPDVPVQSANQQLPDLARAPVGLLAFEGDNQALDLRGSWLA